MIWPFSKKNECKHLVKYQATDIQIAGVSVPNIFSVGSIGIKPQVLQAAENAIKLLDLRHFQNCENLKQITDPATKETFIESMNKQQDKLSNIALAIEAFKINPNSQKLEETLTKLLESDLPLPDTDKAEVRKNLRVDVSQKNIKAKEGVKGGEINVEGSREGEFVAKQENIETEGGVNGSKVNVDVNGNS